MKTNDGYTIKREGGKYYVHEYIVDGCNHDERGGAIIEDTDYCKTRAEAMASMRKFCEYYEYVTIYNEWTEVWFDEDGWMHEGDLQSQVIEDYKKGKRTYKGSIM